MAVTDSQYKALILAELQAEGADLTLLSANIATIWDVWESKARLSSRLRYLYSKRQCVELVLGQHWLDVDHDEGDVSDKASQLSANLQKLRDALSDAIALEEKQAMGTRRPAVGRLTTTAPITVTSGADPNDRAYRGDPIER